MLEWGRVGEGGNARVELSRYTSTQAWQYRYTLCLNECGYACRRRVPGGQRLLNHFLPLQRRGRDLGVFRIVCRRGLGGIWELEYGLV
jgi:hypothetical protein